MISFYTRALLLLRRPPCWNKHGGARTTHHVTSPHATTRTTCRACRVVTCRDVTQKVEFRLYIATATILTPDKMAAATMYRLNDVAVTSCNLYIWQARATDWLRT